MVPKSFFLMTAILSGICSTGLFYSVINADNVMPITKENFEKIQPLLNPQTTINLEITKPDNSSSLKQSEDTSTSKSSVIPTKSNDEITTSTKINTNSPKSKTPTKSQPKGPTPKKRSKHNEWAASINRGRRRGERWRK